MLTLRRFVAWVLGVFLLASTAGALAIAVYPTVTSGAAMAVLSGSMSPEYPVGSMVFTRPVDPAEVAAGDVITFQRPSNPSELVTHRVIAVDTSTGSPVFTTRGDANDAADLDPVPASAVQGRLWFGVPQLGRVAAVLHSPQGVGFLVLLVCGVVALSPGKKHEGDTAPSEEERTPASERRRGGSTASGEDDVPTAVIPAVEDGPGRTSRLPLPPVPPPAARVPVRQG